MSMFEEIRQTSEKNFCVQLVVKDDVVATFEALTKLKELGYAGNDSKIVFNGVLVPAGYCVDFQNFIVTYGAIVSGDQASIFEQVPESLSRRDAIKFLAQCSNSMEKQGREPIERDDVANFLEYRASQKSSGQK